jgi:hypothetical protein
MVDRTTSDGPAPAHYKLVSRDTLDGRVTIEQQILDGETIADTSVVTTTTPAEAPSAVTKQRERLEEGGATVHDGTGSPPATRSATTEDSSPRR